MINKDLIDSGNATDSVHLSDLDHLASLLARRNIDIDSVITAVQAFEVAIPSWALGTGGTRFGRFPGPGEPRNIFEKLDDIAVIHQLTRCTPRVSLHIPWDEPDDPAELRTYAGQLQLDFDAVNSNTFQDQPAQKHTYKFGSLASADRYVRQEAVNHHIHVIEVGKTLGSRSIAIWLADGSSFPGQMHLRKGFERVLIGLQGIYRHLPDDWLLLTEHKPYEPAFYATVVQDWGSSYLLAENLGERACCLVDLGHHLPNTNVELIVARLISAGKLGGFHFNDSAYGDDDLTAGSIRPYRLFLIFNELVDAAYDDALRFAPSYMIDQSHNLKDPVEALLQTTNELQQAFARALLVDRQTLSGYQESNDVLMAELTVKEAFETDVRALVAEARRRSGGALYPVRVFRESNYRIKKATERISGVYVPPQSL